jgi:hypothetical protein
MVVMMVHNTQNYWVFGLFPSSGILENTTFRKLDPQVKVGEKTPTQLVQCLRLALSHLRIETHPVSETSCSLEYQTMGKVQKPSNSVYK